MFTLKLDCKINYIMFIRDEEKTLKKNYVYVSDGKLTVMGLPIKKCNASKLGILILEKYLKEQIIKNLSGKFDRVYIDELIQHELTQDITLIAQDYKVNRYEVYSKKTNCIQKQISLAYMDKKYGNIKLIKNNKLGKVGSSWKYCTIEDAKKLSINDLDLTKVYNELAPFIREMSVSSGGLNDYF